MKKIYLFSLIVFGLCVNIKAQTISKNDKKLGDKLDSALFQQFKPNEPGCAVLVSNKGEIVYKNAFGSANLELNVPMRPDMVFEISSITKQFTGIAIMQLVEQGKMNLEDSINKYIPDYPTHGYYISIEHLLTHTSGIRNFQEIQSLDSMKTLDFTPTQFIALFKNEKMDFAPGTEWKYSNSGYFLLGYIIEKVTGLTYQQYIEEYIFKPAGMSNSFYLDYKNIIKGRVLGYTKVENKFENRFYSSVNPSILYAAGALMCTTEDMFKYYQTLNSYSLVSKEGCDKIRTSYKLANGKEVGYGYGVEVGNIYGHHTIYHAGGANGFFTLQMYFPEKDINFILFTNCGDNFGKFEEYLKIATQIVENI